MWQANKSTSFHALFGKPFITMLGNASDGLSDTINEHDLNQIVHLLRKCEHDWFGPDKDLKISLGDKSWIARSNDPNDDIDYNDVDHEESWTVILNLPRNYRGGPGYKIEVIDLNEMRDHFYSDNFNPDLYGIDDIDVFWAHEDTVIQLMYYIQSNPTIMTPNHYWDKPYSGAELYDVLSDVYSDA